MANHSITNLVPEEFLRLPSSCKMNWLDSEAVDLRLIVALSVFAMQQLLDQVYLDQVARSRQVLVLVDSWH